MVYASDSSLRSIVEMAQAGHLPSVAFWLNQQLAPYRLRSQIGYVRPGIIRVSLELRFGKQDVKSKAFRNRLVRFICHQLWRLNSDVLDGAQVVARVAGKPKILWQQSVRIVSPARKAVLAQSQPPSSNEQPDQDSASHSTAKLRSIATAKSASATAPDTDARSPRPRKPALVKDAAKKQFQMMRSLIISGSSAAAFILGCWLGYADAPIEQTTASAKASPQSTVFPFNHGSVKGALEKIPVIQHKSQNTDPSVSLLFAGDVTLTNSYSDKVSTDHKWAFAPMEEMRQVDVSMVNLEAPFTTATQPLPGKKHNFKAPLENVQVLQNGGIDIVNLANNHTMDYEAAGLTETLTTLTEAGIQHVGAGLNSQQARRPVIMDVKGQRVAYLGYYDADLHAAGQKSAGTNPRHNDRVSADIKAIRHQVDWVIVNYHWGEELAKYPGDWQIDLARFTIDQGADLVVGHHPHVLQGAEVYRGRPIVYSLGNFIFGGKSVSDYDTAALKVSLRDRQMKVELLPVQVKNFQARVVGGQAGDHILEQVKNVSDIFQEPLVSPMMMDTRTNKATPIVPSKPNSQKSEDPAKSNSSNPAPVNNPVNNEGNEPDPDNPWNQDSFITKPDKRESMLQPDENGKPTPASKSVAANYLDRLQSESMQAAESIEEAEPIPPQSVQDKQAELEARAAEEALLAAEAPIEAPEQARPEQATPVETTPTPEAPITEATAPEASVAEFGSPHSQTPPESQAMLPAEAPEPTAARPEPAVFASPTSQVDEQAIVPAHAVESQDL
ncbi:MAG: CapA family protein [Synechococcales bacterium]|nr:CapA family protein [Synechococcales bacterium]